METFTVREVAPTGTAYVGLFFNNPAGRFVDSDNNCTQDRHAEMDNIRLKVVPAQVDGVAYRRTPRLVEPGKTPASKSTTRPLPPTLRVAWSMPAATSAPQTRCP